MLEAQMDLWRHRNGIVEKFEIQNKSLGENQFVWIFIPNPKIFYCDYRMSVANILSYCNSPFIKICTRNFKIFIKFLFIPIMVRNV